MAQKKVPITQKKMTITIVGVITFSEEFYKHFGQFQEAMHKYLVEAFPEFQPINPPVTVEVNDTSPDDLILFPVKEKP